LATPPLNRDPEPLEELAPALTMVVPGKGL